MSNLEHLIENGLCRLQDGKSYAEWREIMQHDVNWDGNEEMFITVDTLWEICQYVICTWCWTCEPNDLRNIDTCENCAMAIEDRPLVTRCNECRYSHWVNHENGNVVCKIGHGVNPPDWFCPDGKPKLCSPGINTSLDECPLDTLVVLTDEYNNMYLGTITAKSNGQLTRGECIDGDAELFYKNKIVGWEPYHPT